MREYKYYHFLPYVPTRFVSNQQQIKARQIICTYTLQKELNATITEFVKKETSLLFHLNSINQTQFMKN